jgi:glycosyltransferase involved in cell wall biosynthesis
MIKVAEESHGGFVEFEKLATAADACLVTADGAAPTLPIAICMAAALPIVSVTNYTTAELLEDRHTALMTAKPSARLLAQRVQDLQADSALAWSIADMAQTEAYEYFSASRMLDQYRTVYQQMANQQPVAIPQMAAGAGLRFHGRG